MCQLLRRNFIAALAPVGVPNCDILVTDAIGERLCAIQVKTRRDIGSDGGWHMGRKHENLTSSSLYYCFVDFGSGPSSPPKTYVVPSVVVAEALRISHQKWLSIPAKNGKPHKDGDMRRFLPCYAHLGLESLTRGWLKPFDEAWERLEAEPVAAN